MDAYVDPSNLHFDARMQAAYVGTSPRRDSARNNGGALAWIAGALRWLVEMLQRRAVIAELDSLSDRELADIGLRRADLPRLFSGHFARGVRA